MSELIEYKCPACGGALEFDSTLQKMKCPFCDSVFDMEELKPKDEELDKPQQEKQEETGTGDSENGDMLIYVCKSCGGEIIGDSTTAATSCPYCGNPVVMAGQFQGTLKPDYIIPFKLDKKAAKEKYLEHIKGKRLLPKLFKDENHIDDIKGVYVPFWVFDSEIEAKATFEAENVRRWSDVNFNYTETSTYELYRSGSMKFRGIPIDGSTKMDDDLMESIEPFYFDDAVPFQSAYLAGYFADKYDVDEKASEPRANTRIVKSAMNILQGSADNGQYAVVKKIDDSVLNLASGTLFGKDGGQKSDAFRIENGTVKYALYPVWLLTTSYKNGKYTFAMNGQTGKFVGDLPVDKGAKNKLFAGVFAGVTAVATALIYLLMG